MVFGLFDGKDAKLKEERESQEHLITQQLKALKLEHELERQNMTQKGLIAQQQMEAEKLRLEQEAAALEAKNRAAAAMAAKNASSVANSSNNNNNNNNNNGGNDAEKPLGPRQKLAQHMDMARRGYEQLVNAIIRPPRCEYTMNHLGSPEFTFLGTRFIREDITLMTERGYRIHCSHWRQFKEGEGDETSDTPQEGETKNDGEEPQTVVVYMHGNASARVEVFQQLSYLLSLGTSVFAFDFAGSGMSDGDFVSLGYYEREDLATVVAHLRAAMGSTVQICLWGRSMGASTALMYSSREASLQIQNVACLILDSSFCDLIQLATEMVDKAREQGIMVPGVVVSVALAAIGWSVQSKAQFDIRAISPVKHAAAIDIPALFICGEQDDFIKPHHSERIAENYKGSKNLLMVKGDHNAMRPPIVFQAATQFLSKHLLGDGAPDCLLEVPNGLNLQSAPWQFRNNPAIYKSHHHNHHNQNQRSPNKKNSKTLASQASSSISTTSAIDTTEIGMTKERQENIQSSLVTMLGHEGATTSDTPKEEQEQRILPSKSQEGEEIVLQDEDS